MRRKKTKPQTTTIIGHFRVPRGLCLKTRVGAQPLIWKSFFILTQINLIFRRIVVHLTSFWKWGFLELGSGRLVCGLVVCLRVLNFWPVHNKHSWNFSGVHSFRSLTIIESEHFNRGSLNRGLTVRQRSYWKLQCMEKSAALQFLYNRAGCSKVD